MPTIIMLSGYKRSGKDTVSNFICEHYGAYRLAFADELKRMVMDNYNISPNEMENLKETPLMGLPMIDTGNLAQFLRHDLRSELKQVGDTLYWTPRALMILEGNTRRATNPYYWVDKVINKIKPGSTYIISDFRFKTEYTRIVERFGKENVISVRINRNRNVGTNNESERQLDSFEFDHTIDNSKDLEHLYNQIDELIQQTIFGG